MIIKIDDLTGSKIQQLLHEHLRKDVAKELLLHIMSVAKSRGCQRLSLETGSQDSFEPARLFYQGLGFEFCEPFEGYEEDPNSVFLTLNL